MLHLDYWLTNTVCYIYRFGSLAWAATSQIMIPLIHLATSYSMVRSIGLLHHASNSFIFDATSVNLIYSARLLHHPHWFNRDYCYILYRGSFSLFATSVVLIPLHETATSLHLVHSITVLHLTKWFIRFYCHIIG